MVDVIPSTLYGLRVRTSPLLVKRKFSQFRFPRSRKRRIRKKWAKRPENFAHTIEYMMLRKGNEIWIHPDVWKVLLKKNAEDRATI